MTGTLDDTLIGADKAWLLTAAGCIFSMQVGLAWLEAGAVRRKNQSSIYWKLLINIMVTVMTFWLFGYAFAYGDGEGAFIGGARFYAGNKWEETFLNFKGQWTHFVFQVCIACVLPAVTGGVVSERITFKAGAVHTFFMMLIIYPVILCWTWGEGWLYKEGYADFTGSGMVHVTAAFAGLACLLIVGPRYQRWNTHKDVFAKVQNKPAEKTQENTGAQFGTPTKKNVIPAVALQANTSPKVNYVVSNASASEKSETSSDPSAFTQENISKMRKHVIEESYDAFEVSDLSLVGMGGLFLWFGFQFFNAGSSLFIQNETYYRAAEQGAANTYFAGAGAGLWTLLLKTPIMEGSFSAKRVMKEECASVVNGLLAGMVANGAGMNTYVPWESFVVGLVGASFYMFFCKFFANRKLDDALEAFPLHGGGGMAGVLCAGIFSQSNGFLHENSGKFFGWHIVGLICIAAWSFFLSLIVFYVLDKMGWLRVDLKTEIVGYDFIDYADHLKFEGGEKPTEVTQVKPEGFWATVCCCFQCCGRRAAPKKNTTATPEPAQHTEPKVDTFRAETETAKLVNEPAKPIENTDSKPATVDIKA